MPISRDTVGQTNEPMAFSATPGSIERYTDAVGDHNPRYRKGPDSIAPPLYPIVAGWDAMADAVSRTVSADLLARAVHLIQDMRFVRPIRASDALSSRATITGIVGGERGTSVVCHVVTTDADGGRVADFYATSYVRGHTGEETSGEPAPPLLSSPEGEPVGIVTVDVDDDQTHRYAEASGDHNPIHTSEEAARSVGLPGIIVHGMCTLAMACAACVDNLCDGDPARLKRFAGRFSKPVQPGQRLVTTFWRSASGNGRQVVAFTVGGPDGAVVRDGVAEIA